MSSEVFLGVSQIVVAVGIILTAFGGYGAFYFGKKLEAEETRTTAYAGSLEAAPRTVISGQAKVWPQLEFGDSGAIFVLAGPQGGPFMTFGADTDLTVIEQDGHVKVSLPIRDKTGALVAEIVNNEWKVNPQNSWDRNYTDDRLEVRDPSGDIVLQVRVLPDRVQLQAKFFNSAGRGFGFGKILGPQGWGGGLEFTGSAHPELELRIDPAFKYPSALHFGELANDA